jgi:hypothetical protein
MGNVASFSKLLYYVGMVNISTLLGKPKLINLSVNPKFTNQPIIYEIDSTNLLSTSSFVKVPNQNNIYRYTSSTAQQEVIIYKASQLNPLTNKMEIITKESFIIFNNFTQQQINDMPKKMGSFTFDNISFDGDTWQIGTISSNYFVGPIINESTNTHIYELGEYISTAQPPQTVYGFYNHSITRQRSIEQLDTNTNISSYSANIDTDKIDTLVSCFNNSFTKIQILDKEHAIKYNSKCIYLVVDNNKLIRKKM